MKNYIHFLPWYFSKVPKAIIYHRRNHLHPPKTNFCATWHYFSFDKNSLLWHEKEKKHANLHWIVHLIPRDPMIRALEVQAVFTKNLKGPINMAKKLNIFSLKNRDHTCIWFVCKFVLLNLFSFVHGQINVSLEQKNKDLCFDYSKFKVKQIVRF